MSSKQHLPESLDSHQSQVDCYVLNLLGGSFFLQNLAWFPNNLDVFILIVFSFLGMLGVLPLGHMF